MTRKECKSLLYGSPMVVIQFALFIYMTVFGLMAVFQSFDNVALQWIYAISLIITFVLMMTASVKCYIT